MEQEFEDYLRKKKIDPEAFKINEPETFRSFKDQFLHVHPESFTVQKLFLINLLRRKYHFQNEPAAPAGTVKAKAKPVVRKPSSNEKAIEGDKKPRIKPKTTKPVVPPKKEIREGQEHESSETAKKPKFRPKIKPKVKTSDKEEPEKEKTFKPKPVVKKKPVIKPKIRTGENSAEHPEEKVKPKKSKPIIKPRIPKKDN